MDLAIILQAAGFSSRYGSNKLLHIMDDGQPMVCRILDIAAKQKACRRILVTQYDEVAALASGYDVVMNDHPELGISHSMQLGIEAAGRPRARIQDIGTAVQKHAEKFHYGVVREYCGHGVGFSMHEEPSVPNFITRGISPRLREGMVIAIEPMIMIGSEEIEVLDDDWTVVTADNSLACHFEHTVAVHDGYAEILTKLPD